jgi:hypothetical protein
MEQLITAVRPFEELIQGSEETKARLYRVHRYLNKKHKAHEVNRQQIQYKCRKTVADKRLRIKGRFVTKEQAFEILGLT